MLGPRTQISPSVPGGTGLLCSSSTKTSTPVAMPMLPGFLSAGGSRSEVIWPHASVIPWLFRTGTANALSSFCWREGSRGLDPERMKRKPGGIKVVLGSCRTITCVVGVPVYHVTLYVTRSVQKDGVRRVGIMVVPSECREERVAVISPCMWKIGIMRMVRL